MTSFSNHPFTLRLFELSGIILAITRIQDARGQPAIGSNVFNSGGASPQATFPLGSPGIGPRPPPGLQSLLGPPADASPPGPSIGRFDRKKLPANAILVTCPGELAVKLSPDGKPIPCRPTIDTNKPANASSAPCGKNGVCSFNGINRHYCCLATPADKTAAVGGISVVGPYLPAYGGPGGAPAYPYIPGLAPASPPSSFGPPGINGRGFAGQPGFPNAPPPGAPAFVPPGPLGVGVPGVRQIDGPPGFNPVRGNTGSLPAGGPSYYPPAPGYFPPAPIPQPSSYFAPPAKSEYFPPSPSIYGPPAFAPPPAYSPPATPPPYHVTLATPSPYQPPPPAYSPPATPAPYHVTPATPSPYQPPPPPLVPYPPVAPPPYVSYSADQIPTPIQSAPYPAPRPAPGAAYPGQPQPPLPDLAIPPGSGTRATPAPFVPPPLPPFGTPPPVVVYPTVTPKQYSSSEKGYQIQPPSPPSTRAAAVYPTWVTLAPTTRAYNNYFDQWYAEQQAKYGSQTGSSESSYGGASAQPIYGASEYAMMAGGYGGARPPSAVPPPGYVLGPGFEALLRDENGWANSVTDRNEDESEPPQEWQQQQQARNWNEELKYFAQRARKRRQSPI